MINKELIVTISELVLPSGDVVSDADFLVNFYVWYIDRIPKQEIDSIIYLGQEHKKEVDKMIDDDFEFMSSIMFDITYW